MVFAFDKIVDFKQVIVRVLGFAIVESFNFREPIVNYDAILPPKHGDLLTHEFIWLIWIPHLSDGNLKGLTLDHMHLVTELPLIVACSLDVPFLSD